MSCVTRFQVLMGTSVQRLSIVPLLAELVFDTDLKVMFVGDGVTLGGIPFSGEVPAPVISIFSANQNISGIDFAIADSPTNITFTLPDATMYTKPIRVKNFGAGEVTVQPVLGQLIDSFTDVQLRNKNAVVLVPKNGGWYIW